jgi:hypothetical protein
MYGLSDSNNLSMTAHTKKHVISHPENLSRQLLEAISAPQERIDFCMDHKGLSFLVTYETVEDIEI